MPAPSASTNWSRVAEVFDAVVSAPPTDRDALLARLAEGDPGVDAEVRSLLAALDQPRVELSEPGVLGIGRPGSAPRAALPPGTRLGPWTILRPVAEGGMGTVYEAARADATYQGRVAIKTLSRAGRHEGLVRRLVQERQILASLQHPHIASLLDGGTTADGLPYLVMEFVEGEPLDTWCDSRQLPIALRLDLFQQVCDAVQHAHRKLVVHRDLKPSNILVTPEGMVKVVDFGIAKLLTEDGSSEALTTHSGTPLTPGYASPEQVRGEEVTTATDVYSLGVVLHRLLAGGSPYLADAAMPLQLMAAVTTEVPLPPSATATDAAARARGLPHARSLREALARELDAIVLMALRKEPERRYASADALADDVRRFLRGLPVSARADTLGYRLRTFARRQRALVAGLTIALVAITGGAVAALWQARHASQEAARAERIATFMQTVLGAGDAMLGTSGIALGPRGSVEALLDAAAARVAREFADDPRSRARLYTSLGSGLMTRARFREAEALLDSAQALARGSYGAGSPEFVFALTEAAVAAMMRNRHGEATRYLDQALTAVQDGHLAGQDLHVRVLRDLATRHFVRGDLVALDSVARQALAMERRLHAAPTVMRAAILNRLVAVAVLHEEFPRADTLVRTAVATYDSATSAFTVEKADLLANAGQLAMLSGRFAEADSLCRLGSALAGTRLGPSTREVALLDACAAMAALTRQDVASADSLLGRSVQIVDSLPEVGTPVATTVYEAWFTLQAVKGQWARADSIGARTHALVQPTGSWFERSRAAMLWARSRGTLSDLAGAMRLLAEAERLEDSAGVRLPSMISNRAMLRAQVYTLQGEQSRVDALLPLLTVPQRQQFDAWRALVAARR